MISKRELSGRRELKNIASVFDTVKGQRDKAIECLKWYWLHVEANLIQDSMIDLNQRVIKSKKTAFKEIENTIINSWDNFERMAEEIRKEMEE